MTVFINSKKCKFNLVTIYIACELKNAKLFFLKCLEPNPELWRKITLYGALPIVLLASINMYLIEKKHAEHEEEEIVIVEADYMGKLTRQFPWRDGTKSLFYNPKIKRVRPE